jgi:hypothetical protein
MPQLTDEMLSLLLANCIKQFGTENVLRLKDQEVLNPSVLSLHPDEGHAILMLLEGQIQIDEWEKGMKKLEETIEVSKRGGEPEGTPE